MSGAKQTIRNDGIEIELCNLIFNNVEAYIDYVSGDPVAVLSDVKTAADAIILAGYRKQIASFSVLQECQAAFVYLRNTSSRPGQYEYCEKMLAKLADLIGDKS